MLQSEQMVRLRIACFLFALGLAGCGRRPDTHGRIDTGLVPFIPADSVMLAGVRMDQLRAAPLYRKLVASGRLPRFNQFRAGTGVDPERDIRELLLASDGKSTLAIARGAFPTPPPGAAATPYQGYAIYTNGDNGAYTRIDNSIALAGPAQAVRAAIDRYKRGNNAPAGLLARAANLPLEAQIWSVTGAWTGFGADRLRNMGNAANLDRILRSVEDSQLTADLRSGLHLAAAGDCRTEQDAATLTESLRGLAGLARLGVSSKQPDVLKVFDAIQIRQDGRSVKLNLNLPADVVEKLSN